MKRFQECNWLVKLWRYRHYCYIPFKWFWYSYINPMKIPETAYDDELCMVTINGEEYIPKGKNLWGLLTGMAQGPMKWYYTSEEVFAEFDLGLKKEKKEWVSGCDRPPIDHGDVDEY